MAESAPAAAAVAPAQPGNDDISTGLGASQNNPDNRPSRPQDKAVAEALEETPAPKKTYKFKYKNEEEEVSEDEMVQRAHHYRGSQKAFEQAKKLREEAEAIKEKYDGLKDPSKRATLMQELLGDDFRRVAEETLIAEMEKEKAEEGLSEREKYYRRQIEKQQEEITNFHKQHQTQEQARTQARQEAVYNGVAQQIEAAALDAMQQLNVPHQIKPHVAQRMVPYVEAMLENDIPLDPQAIANFAMNDLREEHLFLTKQMDAASLVKYLGDDAVKKIRAYDLERYNAKRNGVATSPTPQTRTAPSTNGRKEDGKHGVWERLAKEHGIRRP